MIVVEAIAERLEGRARGLQADDPVRLESVAYQIQNFYNAIEDLLKIVAAHFENQISDTARWHTVLLQRMTQQFLAFVPSFSLKKVMCY